MATRSTIAILNNDGTVTAIYCHWDGYLEHHGLILSEYYQEREKVEELLNNGDLSALRENINPTKEHSFEKPQDDVCIYYHRDREEDWESNKPRNYDGLNKLWDAFKNSDREYLYIHIGNDWYYTHWNDSKIALKHLKTAVQALETEE